MRTTIDLPDPLYRRLKAHAALQGLPMKDLVLSFVERGLRAPPQPMEPPPPEPRVLPTLGGTASLPPSVWSNAGLFELLDNHVPDRPAGAAPRD